MVKANKFEEELCKRIKFLCKTASGQWPSQDKVNYVDETGIQFTLGLANFRNQSPESAVECPLCWPDEKNHGDSCSRVAYVKKDEANKILENLEGSCKSFPNIPLSPKGTIIDYRSQFEQEIYEFKGPTVIVPCNPKQDVRQKPRENQIKLKCDLLFSKENEKNYVEIKYPRETYTGDYRWFCQDSSEDIPSLSHFINDDGHYGCFDLPLLKKHLPDKEGIFYITDCGEGTMIVDLVRLLTVEGQGEINRYFVAFFKKSDVKNLSLMQKRLALFLKYTKTEKSIEGLLTIGKDRNVHLHIVTEYQKSNLYYFRKGDGEIPFECEEFLCEEPSEPQFKFLFPDDENDQNTFHLFALLVKILPSQNASHATEE